MGPVVAGPRCELCTPKDAMSSLLARGHSASELRCFTLRTVNCFEGPMKIIPAEPSKLHDRGAAPAALLGEASTGEDVLLLPRPALQGQEPQEENHKVPSRTPTIFVFQSCLLVTTRSPFPTRFGSLPCVGSRPTARRDPLARVAALLHALSFVLLCLLRNGE